MEDKKIIELFTIRSEKAIEELSAKYGTLCNKIANNILNNKYDAEECVNDAYLGVWNTIPPQNPSHLKAYVLRIVRNQALKKYHSNTAVKRNSYYDVAFEELSDCLASSQTTDNEIDEKELTDMLNNFLGQLNTADRVMFVRRYLYSDSISELAKAFKTSNHYISVKLSRLRKKLKSYLLKEGYDL